MILAIYGSGGLGREILDLAKRINSKNKKWEEFVFIDDIRQDERFAGIRCLSFDAFLLEKDNSESVIALGEPRHRKKLFEKLVNHNVKIATLIDPTAIVSDSANIDAGCIICEYSSIHSEVQLSNNVLIQPFCTLGHNITIGKHSVFSSYSAPGGDSTFGECVFVGMKATLKEKLCIESFSAVGMGSVVYRDVKEGSTVIGNPARVTKGSDSGKIF